MGNMSGISPWVAGQLNPIWQITLGQGADGVLDLTGVTTVQISVLIYSVSYTSLAVTYTQTAIGGGSIAILTPVTAGVIQYSPISTDSSGLSAGTYAVRIKVNFSGSSPYFSDYIPWLVQT